MRLKEKIGRITAQKRKMLLGSMGALFFAWTFIFTPAAASQLYDMSSWDSGDWKLDGGIHLDGPILEGWTSPSHVYFQSVHQPAQEYYSGVGDTQAYSLGAYCYTQVVHQTKIDSTSLTMEFYSPDSSPNLFCDWNEYRIAKVNYWVYQKQYVNGQEFTAWWSGQIDNPKNNEVAKINIIPAYGAITVFLQTEYTNSPIPSTVRQAYVWP